MSDRPSRLPAEFCLHITELALAIGNAGAGGPAHVQLQSTFAPLEPMDWAR